MKKKIILSIAFSAFVFSGLAQVPNAFNYQAVVRNLTGELIANQSVSFKLSILLGSESGTVLYEESHEATTNAFGLVNLKVGEGIPVSGVFSPGGWGMNSHFLKVEMDPAGGSTYTHLGTSELLSVPYAFHAQTVQTDLVEDADASPNNEIQTLSLSGSDLTLSDGGGTVTLPSPSGGDNWGTQAIVSDTTLSGNGTSGDPLGVVGDLTDDQTLSVSGSDLTISNGNTVPIPSIWNLNENSVYYNDGKVGLGTTSPLSELHVYGSSNTSHVLFHNSETGSSYIEGLLVGNTGPMAWFWNGEYGDISFATDGRNRVGIDRDGFVKIGTSSTRPVSLLDLHGGTSPVYTRFHHDNSGYTDLDGFAVGLYNTPMDAYLFNYESGSIYLGTSSLVRMEIDQDGNIGINTMSPTHRLSVNGTAGKTDGGMWSVFSDSRLKVLHGSYDKGLSEIVALQPVTC